MTKVSFPEHMRRLQAALNCAREFALADWIELSFDGNTGFYTLIAFVGDEWEEPKKFYATSSDPAEAVLRLLHAIAGTEPPPF